MSRLIIDLPDSSEKAEPTYADEVADLIVQHDCWTDDREVNDVVPTHVVYSKQGQRTPQPELGGEKKTQQALKQIFTDEDYGLAVYAFCP